MSPANWLRSWDLAQLLTDIAEPPEMPRDAVLPALRVNWDGACSMVARQFDIRGPAMGDVYFDGDPAVDSSRRHMERVLKGEPPRRWPWVAAAVGGGGLWALWRMAEQLRNEKARSEADPPTQPPKP